MATSPLLPLKPPHSVHLGQNIFCQVADFQSVLKIHIRKYAPNAISFVATQNGITLSVDEFTHISSFFKEWILVTEQENPSEVLFNSGKYAITCFRSPTQDRNIINFASAFRKTIDLTSDQFRVLYESLDQLFEWVRFLDKRP